MADTEIRINGGMAIMFRVATVVVPIFTALTMFGVSYGISQLNDVKNDIAALDVRLIRLEESIVGRIREADKQHGSYERRLDRLETVIWGNPRN